ncbi:DNA gyrase subunit B [Streptomyces sp. PB17]|uniref:DNA gyrase subunit B n=1 Tax=Streptomyces sp. PB17 TaxID=3384158 RepID=UPI0038B6428A
MSDGTTDREAGRIGRREARDAIRKRPGMYVGSTGERGVRQMVFEVAGRAVNEVLAGRARHVDVTLTRDGGVRVADDGPGVPVEAAGHTEGPGLETLLTRVAFAPDSADRHTAVLAPLGIWPAVTNALSSRLTAEVRRAGTRWVQEYARGVALGPPVAGGRAAGSGITLTFWPDAGIFDTRECSFPALEERFRELALLNRALSISLTDERPARRSGPARSVRFRFPGGARDFVALLDAGVGTPVHPDVVWFEREDPRMAGTVEVALRWSDARDERVRSFANSSPTPQGGAHVAGLRDGVAAALDARARARGPAWGHGPASGAQRTGEGLTAVVSVKVDRPDYQGSTRGELAGAAVRARVEAAVRERLGTWLEEHPEQADAILRRTGRRAH